MYNSVKQIIMLGLEKHAAETPTSVKSVVSTPISVNGAVAAPTSVPPATSQITGGTGTPITQQQQVIPPAQASSQDLYKGLPVALPPDSSAARQAANDRYDAEQDAFAGTVFGSDPSMEAPAQQQPAINEMQVGPDGTRVPRGTPPAQPGRPAAPPQQPAQPGGPAAPPQQPAQPGGPAAPPQQTAQPGGPAAPPINEMQVGPDGTRVPREAANAEVISTLPPEAQTAATTALNDQANDKPVNPADAKKVQDSFPVNSQRAGQKTRQLQETGGNPDGETVEKMTGEQEQLDGIQQGEGRQNPDFMQKLSDKWDGMDDTQKLGLMIGIPLALIGLFSGAMGGDKWLAGGLGLAGAAGVGHSMGVFDNMIPGIGKMQEGLKTLDEGWAGIQQMKDGPAKNYMIQQAHQKAQAQGGFGYDMLALRRGSSAHGLSNAHSQIPEGGVPSFDLKTSQGAYDQLGLAEDAYDQLHKSPEMQKQVYDQIVSGAKGSPLESWYQQKAAPSAIKMGDKNNFDRYHAMRKANEPDYKRPQMHPVHKAVNNVVAGVPGWWQQMQAARDAAAKAQQQ